MVKIFNKVSKRQKNFWNNCVFHPTDAVEDPWGKRILDQIAKDKSCRYVRIYTMFEDIVYYDGNDALQFDFRVSDLRMDYLVEQGFDLVLAYGGIPDCIARSCNSKSSAAKGKTRYKGKMWNTSPPKTPEIWEEVCYQYTKHIVERYGIERVSKWYVHCLNEADTNLFFLGELDWFAIEERIDEYYALYKAFVSGVRRVTKEIPLGGPALAFREDFLEGFLNRVKADGAELDFISLHFYGAEPNELNDKTVSLSPENILEKLCSRLAVIKKCGFADKPIIIDEWGACSHGFFNREECPLLLFRETEVNSAYFVRLIYDFIHSGIPIEQLMICLSGQHEMAEDFTGFRNFFTLNFIQKPIYNAYVLASKLGEKLLEHSCQNENVSVIPTLTEKGYAILLTYAAQDFLQEIESIEERLVFEKDIQDKEVTVWCIDKTHTNPYRLYQRMGWDTLTPEQIAILREEGKLKPISRGKGLQSVDLMLTAGATFLITVE